MVTKQTLKMNTGARDNKIPLNKQYDTIAQDFSELIKEGNKISREAFRALLPSVSKKTVLDLGCGDGSETITYLEMGACSVDGIDASNKLLEIARNNVSGVNFNLGIFEELPFPPHRFDMVFSKYALMTSPELEPIFREVWRVLKPGGTFMFLVTHPIRQFLEKKKEGKDYFEQEIVASICFDGALTFEEPTHTMNEYFSPFMLKHFTLTAYDEQFDPAAEKIVDTYPGFMILQWQKK